MFLTYIKFCYVMFCYAYIIIQYDIQITTNLAEEISNLILVLYVNCDRQIQFWKEYYYVYWKQNWNNKFIVIWIEYCAG